MKKVFFLKNISYILVIIGIAAFLGGCKNSTTVSQSEETNVSTTNQRKPEKNNWVKPNTHLKGIPIYNTFADIEPLFHLDNDTTYVINFWATWCKPCVEELPYFEEFTAQHKNDKIKVILCSLDFPQKIKSQLLPFLKKNKLKSEVVVLLDGKFNNWIDKVSTKWDGAIPVTYIYKGDKEHFINSSIESSKELEDAINSL